MILRLDATDNLTTLALLPRVNGQRIEVDLMRTSGPANLSNVTFFREEITQLHIAVEPFHLSTPPMLIHVLGKVLESVRKVPFKTAVIASQFGGGETDFCLPYLGVVLDRLGVPNVYVVQNPEESAAVFAALR